MKFLCPRPALELAHGRSRKGAWIEIQVVLETMNPMKGRSRKGAWIEILVRQPSASFVAGRSRKGAWIEIPLLQAYYNL